MAGLESLEQRMGAIATAVKRNADKTVRKVAMAVDQAVVMATPVDTGRARANWIASLDAPVTTATENKDKSGGGAISQAAGVVAGYDGDSNSSINITNNLPYIGPLNDGSSYQAPAGFVERAVRAGANAVKGARLLEGV